MPGYLIDPQVCSEDEVCSARAHALHADCDWGKYSAREIEKRALTRARLPACENWTERQQS